MRYQRRLAAGGIRTWWGRWWQPLPSAARTGMRGCHPQIHVSASTPTTTARWRWRTRWRGVEAGATQVQGTINGYGERCGNMDLVPLIANLQLKLGQRVVSAEQLRRLSEVSQLRRRGRQPQSRRPRAVCRPQRVRAQGRHPCRGGRQGRAQLPAYRPDAGRQPARVVVSRAGRARQCAYARRGARPEAQRQRARGVAADQGAGKSWLPVRGRRGLVRDAGAPFRRRTTSRRSSCSTPR